MIAKRILRPKAASNFARLGAYLLSEKTGPEGDASSLTFGYILSESGAAGRVGAVRITNCAAESPSLAVKEIFATQALNKRSRSDRTYHLVVAFEPGERPTQAQLQDIEDTLCEAIGLGAHQRISTIHTDRAHLHLHIAINKIAPQTLRCVEPFYDKRKLMAACEALEKKHGLAQTNHGRSKAGRPKGKPADLEAHAAEASFLSFVKDKIEAALLEALNRKADWSGVHALLAQESLTLKRRGAGPHHRRCQDQPRGQSLRRKPRLLHEGADREARPLRGRARSRGSRHLWPRAFAPPKGASALRRLSFPAPGRPCRLAKARQESAAELGPRST